jgi:hypothetical protein
MKLLCRLGGHEADPGEIYNSGYWFSRCRRCGCDMIRDGANWATVPEGHRVSWKAGRHMHSIGPDFAGALPILHAAANLPAVQPAFASWSRALAPGARPTAAAAVLVLDEREEASFPRLLVLAALVGAGLQLFFSIGGRQTVS